MGLRLDDTGFGGIKIFQNPDEFCYGVDAVLLADMASGGPLRRRHDTRIMDLGTGTGIVPLIMSHKTDADYIGGIEVQQDSWQLAVKNAEDNHLADRLHFFNMDILDIGKELFGTFDAVTSNPPYTEGSRGIESGVKAKAVARHETTASLDDFVRQAARLLKDRGDFYMVHRPARLVDICQACRKYKLEPKEMRFVSGKPGEKPNILLVHCVKHGKRELHIVEPLAVHQITGEYSEEILKIYEKTK